MSPRSIHAFAEKVALITDGSSRIGRAIALQLALNGVFVNVGYSGISAEAESAINEMRSLGTLANAVNVDISIAAGAKALVENVQDLYGRLDLLVNCVSFRPIQPFQNVTDEIFESAIGANIKSAFFATQAAFPLMKDRPGPKIVNIVSALDSPGTSQDPLFALSQTAVEALTRSLAVSMPGNFRVNCVKVSEKERFTGGSPGDIFQIDKGVPADDVARVVMYLLSGEAIGLNGQILTVE
jgi:3-oxoacyl-[acyl-carrier protein] reductase